MLSGEFLATQGAVHKGRRHIFPYIWPLPPSCLQPSAFHGPLLELVSKALNQLAAILHVYAGGLNFMK